MSDASRQRAKAVEVPEFAAVPLELRREPTTSPARSQRDRAGGQTHFWSRPRGIGETSGAW
eukprot:3904838-Pleurochrysis_carterae.AAC.1